MSLSHHPNIVRNGLVAYFDAANPKSYPAGQDPYVNNVSLMLSMDGANGSTTFTDLSQNALAVTAVGNAQISTTQSKYGGSSAYFDGSGDYLTTPANSIVLGSGDWTIEFWLYLNNSGASNLIDQRSSPTQLAPSIYYNGSSIIYYTLGLDRIIGSSLQLNQWHHIAVVKASSQTKMYLNGTQTGSTYSDSNNYIGPNFTIGAYQPLGNTPPNGYIDDLRITKGISRYNASFTPPTAPLSLPGRITDLTTNKVIGTLTNGPTYSAGAITTDGVNDYINCGNYANANFGTSNFTINMWIKTTSTIGGTILAKSTGDSANASYGWLIYLNATSSGEIGFATATAAGAFSASGNYIIRTSGASVNNGTWKMVTVVANRTSANVSIYINGVLQTLTTWISATASLATVGNITNSQILCIGNESDFNVPGNAAFSAVQLYNKALTVSEVLQNYNATKSRYGY